MFSTPALINNHLHKANQHCKNVIYTKGKAVVLYFYIAKVSKIYERTKRSGPKKVYQLLTNWGSIQ